MNMVKKFFRTKLDKIFWVFLICLFLAKLTPFYFIPIANRIFVSHTLAKAVIGLTFVSILLADFKKVLALVNRNKFLFFLILLYFAGQSLSILGANDIVLFFKGYHNVIFSLFIFFISYYFAQEKKYLNACTLFILASGFLLVSAELIYFFFAEKLSPILAVVVQKEVYDAYLTNLERGRYSLDMNTELFAPFFATAFLTLRKLKPKLWALSGIFAPTLVFITFISNFRTRVVNLVFALLAIGIISFTKLKSTLKIKPALGVLAIFVAILLSLALSNKIFSFNVLDRFALSDKKEDVDTLEFRIEAAKKSAQLLAAYPVFGVGLGNYINYAEGSLEKFGFYLIQEKNRITYQELGSTDPHNIIFRILAETGGFGIITFLPLLAYFLIKDFNFLKGDRTLSFYSSYVISFWTIFVFLLFNPSYSIFVVGWFWFLRGVIEAAYAKALK